MKTKRKAVSVPKLAFLSIEVTDYQARLDAAINHEVKDRRRRHDGTPVYVFQSTLEVEGVVREPEDRVDDQFRLTIYSGSGKEGEFASTLKDCHERDEDGAPKYRRIRGRDVPTYRLPAGIGFLDRVRGARAWNGVVWVQPATVTDRLTLLPNVRPLFLDVREVKIGRTRWIAGLTLQTTNPAED